MMDNSAKYSEEETQLPSVGFSKLFDYAIIFPLVNGNQSQISRHIIYTMVEAGLEMFPYVSVQADELIVLLRCPIKKLETLAAKSDYKMEINADHLRQVLAKGNFAKKINKVEILDEKLITPLSPYEHIFLRFQEENDPELYNTPLGEDNPFITSVRLKLINYLLTAPKRVGGCHLELSHYIHIGEIYCLFPLHDRDIADALCEECTTLRRMPWSDPCYELKEYFGEQIALYNLFIGHMSWWLLFPAIIGIGVQLVVWITMDFSHPILPFFCVSVLLWAFLMLKFWKQKESTTALHWGMTQFVYQDSDRFARPEFKGVKLEKSHINGKEMLYFPPADFHNRLCLSVTIVATFVILVLGVIAAIYLLRFTLQSIHEIGSFSTLISSFLSVAQITLFNFLYQKLSVKLVDKENHRTDLEYQDSLVAKMFTFQSINSFASFFFLAFIAQNLDRPPDAHANVRGQCGFSNCMIPLSINLGIIFGGRMIFKNLLDIVIPYVKSVVKYYTETQGVSEGTKLTPAEVDYMLMEYDPFMENIKNFADSVIAYGYMMLFATALPLGLLFSLFNNFVKSKLTSWKLFKLYQRPIPSSAQNIDSWHNMFTIITIASVVTNGGLIFFTMDLLDDYSYQTRIWFFVAFQWGLIMTYQLINNVISSTPYHVVVQKQRMEFIHEKIIDKIEDDDFDPSQFRSQVKATNQKLKHANAFTTYKKISSKGRIKTFLHSFSKPSVLERANPKNMRMDEVEATPQCKYPNGEQMSEWPAPMDVFRMPHRDRSRILISGFDGVYEDLEHQDIVGSGDIHLL